MKRSVWVSAVFACAACAVTPKSNGPRMADRNTLTQQEIEQSQSITAYDMIRALRPRWLSERGVTSFRSNNPIMLYVNDNRVGTIERLRDYAPRDLREARFLDATQATQRFGTGHRSGAVMLYLRSGAY